jgi:membrane-bound serine protease (ClpP class)
MMFPFHGCSLEESPMTDFLTDPNVVYLILMVGFLLAVLALLAPGTGVIEAVAMFALVIAGYGIIQHTINVWALVVMLAGLVPFVIAIRRHHPGNWLFLLLSILALVIGSAYLMQGAIWWQPSVNPVLALVVSSATAGLLWLVGHKGLEAMARRPTTVLDRVVGATGKAETPVHLEGTVYVAGENWSAHSEKPIPVEAQVRVIKREGFVLEVEELPK